MMHSTQTTPARATAVRRRSTAANGKKTDATVTLEVLSARLDSAADWATQMQRAFGKLSERLAVAERLLADVGSRDSEHYNRCLELLREAKRLERAAAASAGPF